MLEGVDYSHARPGGAALKSAGKHFVGRYLYPNSDGTGKGLTAPEVADLHAHGVDIFCIYEGAAGDMKNGHGQGVADAKLAQAQLAGLAALSHSLPIYFAVDWDASGSDFAAIDAYLQGAASVIGLDRVGVYGGYNTIAHVEGSKTARWFFQTYAWSSSRVRAGIHLFQYSNGQWSGQVDFCRALTAEYGQHAPVTHPAPVPAPSPAPTPVPVPVPAPVPAPVPSPIPPNITPPTPEEAPGMYVQATNEAAIYWFNRATGTKRHITPAEWTVAHLNESGGHVSVVTLPATDVAGIPNG